MAMFNEILVGRFNRLLQKLTGIKGAAPVPSLGAELLPVLPVFFGVENRYLDSWNRFSFELSLTGVTNAAIRLRIPGASNIIVVVESIVAAFTAADFFGVRIDPTGAGTDLGTISSTNNITSIDGRGQTNPNAIISQATVGPVTFNANYPQIGSTANTIVQLINTDNQELPLIGTPGTGGAAITFRDTSAAGTLTIGMIWRERLLEESERT